MIPLRALFAGLLVAGLGVRATEPVVRMLVPGFTVQELPVKLSNQNNLRFAPDGTLTSLGYDGKVWRLRDTNGDGLEDIAEPFWDRPTLSVPLGMAWSTHGLYVSSKGKVSLLRDTDADGRADSEEVIASGWPVTDVGSGGVDATAVTLDKDGNLFFGLLVADYSNAYRLRKRGDLKPAEVEGLKQNGRWREPAGPEAANDEFSLYDLNSKRGTIQKFDPHTKRLETVATGLRVPVALAFNREGDLFNTDQEGETWMPNGNPLDELNHVILGRNYGFPPRHDRWLPDLVSEPPVVGFGPQHQSACGLVFNEPRAKSEVGSRKSEVPLAAFPAQGLFGPKWWEGDAFVAGESRGKIWRVRLVKTPHGYVGKSYTIARLSMLTLDLAISPKGDLYVCCHSGPPDWGTGPQGEGRIFKISYTDPKAPQPVAVWPASPTEVRIAFDRPLDPSVTNSAMKAAIEFGEYVSAGDRFEVLKPPYAVVEQQAAIPRGQLTVHGAELSEDRQELLLRTGEHSLASNYALSLFFAANRQSYAVETEYDLTGVRAIVLGRSIRGTLAKTLSEVGLGEQAHRLGGTPDDFRQTIIDTWMPVPDAEVAARLVSPWQGPQRVVDALRSRGQSGFRVDLHPARQLANLAVTGDVEFYIQSPAKRAVYSSRNPQGRFALRLPLTTNHYEVRVRYEGEREPKLEIGTLPTPDGRMKPLLPSDSYAFRLSSAASAGTDSRPVPKPQGDWEHGRELFNGTALNCAKCHRIRGEGGVAGPDLSNLIHRDARSVERDIREPSATLHPDYVTYLAELKNGDSLTGFIRSQGDDSIRLFEADGKDTVIPRADLQNLHPTGQSLMPTSLLDTLKPDDVRDLMTFLLWEPPVRTKAEAERVLGAPFSDPARTSLPTSTPDRRTALRIVLVASKQDHGPGQHDYPRWQEKWLRLLAQAATNAAVEKAWEWPSAEQFATADVLVFYFWNHDWSPTRYAQLDTYQQRGGGVVILHSACIADREPEKLAERIGLSAQPGTVSYRHMPFELRFTAKHHPLAHGLPETLHFLDEPYWPLIGDPARVTVLATGRVDGADKPLVWTFERPGVDGRSGRVFGSILGHYFWTLDDPLYRLLVLRAIAWAGGAELDRLRSATLPEAALK